MKTLRNGNSKELISDVFITFKSFIITQQLERMHLLLPFEHKKGYLLDIDREIYYLIKYRERNLKH